VNLTLHCPWHPKAATHRSYRFLAAPLALLTSGCPQRTIHVLVALCDNAHQGIVKVPAGIGNGQPPRNNLYRGAGYGVKTWSNKAAEREALSTTVPGEAHLLERCVRKYRDSLVYLVADAYDGRHIREATEDLLRFASGDGGEVIEAGGVLIGIGGRAGDSSPAWATTA
jgi:hypothetical protein